MNVTKKANEIRSLMLVIGLRLIRERLRVKYSIAFDYIIFKLENKWKWIGVLRTTQYADD